MALPMDEQRILEEMERMLAADDPKLAARLAAFGQPGIGHVLQSRRARTTLSMIILLLVAAVVAVVYMMAAFRPGSASPGSGPAQHSSQPAVPPGTSGLYPARCASTLVPSCQFWTLFAKPGLR